jgi:hypothetical protein
MDEHDETSGFCLGHKQIKAVSRPLAIDHVDRGAAAAQKFVAIGLRRLHPGRWPAITAGTVGAIGVGVVPVRNLVEDHVCRLPFGLAWAARANRDRVGMNSSIYASPACGQSESILDI